MYGPPAIRKSTLSVAYEPYEKNIWSHQKHITYVVYLLIIPPCVNPYCNEFHRRLLIASLPPMVLFHQFSRAWINNSLMIQEEKIKEITNVKEVWKCDINYQNIWWTFAFNFSKNYCLRSCIKHSKECFNRFPNDSNLARRGLAWKIGCTSLFEPTSWCLESDEMLFVVFDSE